MKENDKKRLPGVVSGVTPKEETETGNEISHFVLDAMRQDLSSILTFPLV